ncbi:unnamed protein product [Cuscuta epithymum]|uniref:Smr domain-containing protein n=1 Tax=Cuscuta epithymum TaxID=186058 RepID=A0AAV0C4I6_9ASTE|nr:unnamed protein product [Cuscuta epithymum]CAH9136442.1 unnamed protein product [Cuscuta epithymum]
MAYYLCTAPAFFYPEFQQFCNSLHCSHFLQLPVQQKPSPLSLRIRRTTPFQISQVSIQNDAQALRGPSKSHVWINPDSPRASKLKEDSYDFKLSSLMSISNSLDSCNAVEEDVMAILAALSDKAVQQHHAVYILNNMSNPDTALLALNYFRRRFKLTNQVILYNVTLKVLRKNKYLSEAEKLFDEMLERGVKPDNVTFSTIISCARFCSLPEKAVEWFEKMPAFGCQPDDITYATMIDSYGRSGNLDKALNLYDCAREKKMHFDAKTFCSLIRVYIASGNYDGCLNVYEEMKGLGIKPDMAVYNHLLHAMGRAKRPWKAKDIYIDMIQNRFQPNWATYAALIQAYCRARYGEDSLNVYMEMKEKGMALNTVLYNTLLAMCADLGLIDEALEIYNDMKGCKTSKPDRWTFSSLVTVYSCSGNFLEAEAVMDEMTKEGLEPDIFVLTSLVRCYGNADRFDDVVRTFNHLLDLGLTPDERFCGCLLNVLKQTPRRKMHKLTACLEKAMPKLGYIVKLLLDGKNANGTIFKKEANELFHYISTGVRKAFCNSLIDICVSLNQLEKACELLDLGIKFGVYNDIQSKESTCWYLNLKSLSCGAALTALHVWMKDMNRDIRNGVELPSLLGINTGHGKHKYSNNALADVLESHLQGLNAPFHRDPQQLGWFSTTKVAATLWLESREPEKDIAFPNLVIDPA